MPPSPPALLQPLPSPPSPKHWQLKRRSKSVGDLSGKQSTAHYTTQIIRRDGELIHCDEAYLPALPVAPFDHRSPSLVVTELPGRRHSSCYDPSSKDCLRVATIYGCLPPDKYADTCTPQQGAAQESKSTTTTTTTTSPPPKRRPLFLHSNNSLSSAQTGLTAPPNKLSIMFNRRQTLGSTSFSRLSLRRRSKDSLRRQPSNDQTDVSPRQRAPHQKSPQEVEKAQGIVSAIMAAANRPADDQSTLGWVGVEENTGRESATYQAMDDADASPPTPPIENDPHVFDVLVDNSSQFITFSRRNDNPNVVNSATIEKLVEKLTSDIDSDLILVFFLTYRQFLTGIKLCKLLILRFRWALMQDTDDRLLVRIRTFVVLRYWLTHYWQHDFATSRTLRFMLSTFLSQLRSHPTIMASSRDSHIIESLRNIFKRQRSLFKSIKNFGETQSIRSSVSNMDTFLSHHTSRSSTPNPSQRSASSCNSAPPQLHQHTTGKNSLNGIQRQLKPSTSTPTLSFLSRARRHSTNSQRSVTENNAWSARLNFRLKTIKRSVPAMYSNVLTTSHQHQASACLCGKSIHRPGSLIRSAGQKLGASTLSGNVHKHHPPRQDGPTPSPASPTQSSSDASLAQPTCPLHSSAFDSSIPSPLTYHISSNPPTSTTTQGPLYHPFILRYRSEVISRQFCLIEQQMLQNVTWDELVELRWRNSKKRSPSPSEEYRPDAFGVEQLINYFNMACQWIASEVVQTQSLETRALVVEKYIRIALKCYHHRNYSTLMQILLGLQSPAVARLQRTWQRVDQYEIQIFNELKELAKPFLNWKNVRAAMSEAIESMDESSAVESVLTRAHMDPAEIKGIRGCIPFLGLYLSDLVFNAELPTVIALSTHSSETLPAHDDAALCSRLSTHLVNYNKCRIIASIVKHVMTFQVLSRAYTFQYHSELYNQLKDLTFLDITEIYRASLLCEN